MTKVTYKPHLDLKLNNNPLSEAIQPELSKEGLIRSLKLLPNIQGNFWELPELYQQTQLRQLTDVHIPIPQTWNLYNKMLSLILYSYVHRKPFLAKTRILNGKISECMRLGGMYDPVFTIGPTTAPTVLVQGDSGSGKSKGIRSVLVTIQQVHHHQSYQGEHFKKDQLVWVSFDLPPNGSPKAMATNFFKAVDRALGTSYEKEWTSDIKISAEKLMGAMQHVASTHCLGLVHIDELQFMLGYAKIKGSPSLQTLEALFNKIGVPIIQSSTQQGVELFRSLKEGDHRLGHDITTVRRMLNDRGFKFSTHAYESAYFDELFNALFPSKLILGSQTELTNFKKSFHNLSCGLPAIMTRLAHMHHETLMILLSKEGRSNKDDRTYDTGLLNRVFKNQFSLIAPALVELRNGNRASYEKSIRNDETKKTTYSNKEMKAENKKSSKAVKQIAVLKTDGDISVEPLNGQALTLDDFKIGIEVGHEKN
jgi:hypothetical protein